MPDLIRADEQLDDLLRAVSEEAEAAVILANTRPYLITEDDGGTFWAWSYLQEGDAGYCRKAEEIPLPWTVLSRPGGPSAPAAGREQVNRIALILKAAWDAAEPDHNITKFPASFMTTFADMARAVLDSGALPDAKSALTEEAVIEIIGSAITTGHLPDRYPVKVAARAVVAAMAKGATDAVAPTTRQIARVMKAHEYRAVPFNFNAGCACGWRGATINSADDHRAHVAEKLAEMLPGRTEAEVEADALIRFGEFIVNPISEGLDRHTLGQVRMEAQHRATELLAGRTPPPVEINLPTEAEVRIRVEHMLADEHHPKETVAANITSAVMALYWKRIEEGR